MVLPCLACFGAACLLLLRPLSPALYGVQGPRKLCLQNQGRGHPAVHLVFNPLKGRGGGRTCSIQAEPHTLSLSEQVALPRGPSLLIGRGSLAWQAILLQLRLPRSTGKPFFPAVTCKLELRRLDFADAYGHLMVAAIEQL